jgi:hypothetical protein
MQDLIWAPYKPLL